MKRFCILLALLFSFLACYPCSDKETCADERESGVQVILSNHEHSSNEIDLCSPFCICSCCSNQINQPTYFYFDVYSPDYGIANPPNVKSFVITVSLSIWQPPRLA